MSWHYLRELVGEYSEESLQEHEQFAPLRSTHTVEKCFSDGRRTACYHCSQYGTTLEHLKESHGVDVWISSLGGFPCQDISIAGRGAGINGERSGLWAEMFRVVREVRPKYVFVENSPALTSRGLCRVLGDLASIGFDAEWDVFGARHVGAPHKRDRIWILAYSRCERGNAGACQILQPEGKEPIGEDANNLCKKSSFENGGAGTAWWCSEPEVGRVVNGVAHRVDQLRAIGNGQVPAVAKLALDKLNEEKNNEFKH